MGPWSLGTAGTVWGPWDFEVKCKSLHLQPHGLYRPWNSPGQNTGVGRLRGHKKVLILNQKK